VKSRENRIVQYASPDENSLGVKRVFFFALLTTVILFLNNCTSRNFNKFEKISGGMDGILLLPNNKISIFTHCAKVLGNSSITLVEKSMTIARTQPPMVSGMLRNKLPLKCIRSMDVKERIVVYLEEYIITRW